MTFSSFNLHVTKDLVESCPDFNLIGIFHALSDTTEFLQHILNTNKRISEVFAKPYSYNLADLIKFEEELGLKYRRESYATIEGSDLLLNSILKGNENDEDLVIVDVGGYFVKPLSHISQRFPEKLPKGVVEVTTFGHNRYLDAIQTIDCPVFSVARSPLKDVEALYVGESAYLALDNFFRSTGKSLHGKSIGMVGFGMIGRRVVQKARDAGHPTYVYDIDPVKLLDARSYHHTACLSSEELFNNSRIVLASTGGQSIDADSINKYAQNGTFLASVGSKMQEIDISGLTNIASDQFIENDFLKSFTLFDGRKIYLFRDGKSINFAMGSCPDTTMDIVFSEITAAIKEILNDNFNIHQICELPYRFQQDIASRWLEINN